jgi:hypothetical protein
MVDSNETKRWFPMNQKGGAMVEATLVFPIIILSLMAIIGILLFLYEEAATQAELHLVIRTEVGRQTGTFQGKQGSSSVSLDKGFKGIHSVINGSTAVTFAEITMLTHGFRKPITSYQHMTDERKYARYVDFFAPEEKENGGKGEDTVQ